MSRHAARAPSARESKQRAAPACTAQLQRQRRPRNSMCKIRCTTRVHELRVAAGSQRLTLSPHFGMSAVVLEHRIYVYNFADLKLLHQVTPAAANTTALPVCLCPQCGFRYLLPPSSNTWQSSQMHMPMWQI